MISTNWVFLAGMTHKTSKSLIFIVVPQASSKSPKKKPKREKEKEMLDVIRTYNNNNYELTWFVSCARYSFFKLCLKVLMLLPFFVYSGDLFHLERPKKESEFWPAVVLQNECFNLR